MANDSNSSIHLPSAPPEIERLSECYLIRFAQVHETFRKPEIEALALLARVKLEWVDYKESSPYCILRLSHRVDEHSHVAARRLLSRSISAKSIHEIWGTGRDWPSLHDDVCRRTSHIWHNYKYTPFKFAWDSYLAKGSRSMEEQKEVINSFSYLGLEGEIAMGIGKGEDREGLSIGHCWTIFEEFGPTKEDVVENRGGEVALKRVFFGMDVGISERQRGMLSKYSLKKRKYINTTSMDAEIAFLTANLTLAEKGKLFLDPFVGTGGLPLACAHFGARCWGSDIDGRMIRGKDFGGEKRDLRTNFEQYDLSDLWMDGFVADLTNSPLRMIRGGWLDGIVCDPPYGIREGLKVLGRKEGTRQVGEGRESTEAYMKEGYVPPRRAYSLEAMLGDILVFSARMLVDEGRISLWMPTANDVEEELAVPQHPALELMSMCVQGFNKWSRRLLTYRRIPGIDAKKDARGERMNQGTTADELNEFRRRYFQGFMSADQSLATGGSIALPERGKNQMRPPPGILADEHGGHDSDYNAIAKQASTEGNSKEFQTKLP